MVYSREIEGKVYRFGVSGLLYHNNLLMYDRQTGSLWSQLRREAVAGPTSGQRLRVITSHVTTWSRWLAAHPETYVLSSDTGYVRDYSRDPYAAYYRSNGLTARMFGDSSTAADKVLVVGVDHAGEQLAFSVKALREQGLLQGRTGQGLLTVRYHAAEDRIEVVSESGEITPHLLAYWVVWKGIYPDSRLLPTTPGARGGGQVGE